MRTKGNGGQVEAASGSDGAPAASSRSTVRVAGKTLDLATVGPMTWGEAKLLRLQGLGDEVLAKGDPEVTEKFLLFFLQRLNPELTPEDIDAMTVADCQRVARYHADTLSDVDRPT